MGSGREPAGLCHWEDAIFGAIGRPAQSVGAAILFLVRFDPERGIDAGELVQPLLDLGLLLLQKLDLLEALFAAQAQRLGISIALFGGDHLPDLTEREAELLALENQREPRAIAVRIEPVHALPVRGDQSLVLVKPECP